MPRISAGLLLYRRGEGALEVLLVHPGGPLWRRRDAGAWTIPKGEVEPGEDDLAAAIREFAEETGLTPPGPYLPLGEVRQKGGKIVRAWACADRPSSRAERCLPVADSSAAATFTMEWPPKSGRFQTFPEIDRAGFFTLAQAREKINPAQAAFLSVLEKLLAETP
jgi:predicted NUDIX family NTP pyrophosphohydrolase